MTRYIFITGGVASSLGKGLTSAALGALLQARGYSVRLRKLDPYLNIDPGTMSPYQHGEVYVTDDGAETDLDLGHYERFTGVAARRSDSVTSGQVYAEVLRKERRGDYLGATVQVIPHVTDQIKEYIARDVENTDFIICEIGGTVGDIEGLPFLEAIRQFRNDLEPGQSLFIHLTLLPYLKASGELKTKPTQHSVKELLSVGIRPDILVCRSEHEIPEDARRKIALFCNVRTEDVIPALDVSTIYEAPMSYQEAGLDVRVLKAFGIEVAPKIDLSAWEKVVHNIKNPAKTVNIAIIGKYTGLKDAYKSLEEALIHGGVANGVGVNIHWLGADDLENEAASFASLNEMDAILVPGGFGARGTLGKIKAIQLAREAKIPFLGICFGMQLAVIEAAQHLSNLPKASSTEFGPTEDPVICLLTEWQKEGQVEKRDQAADLGGSMRLGAYPCHLVKDSKIAAIYGREEIAERHRHRFEVNMNYKDRLEAAGMRFSGMSPDGQLPEIIEYPDHPWFIGVQFHPELKSKPLAPHPLFISFIKSAREHSDKKKEKGN